VLMFFDRDGNRKYMVVSEWRAFLAAAETFDPKTHAFCHALLRTGGRVSEVCMLRVKSIDFTARHIVLYCLKRRQAGVYRAVPADRNFLDLLEATFGIAAAQSDPDLREARLWSWCRSTAWSRVRTVAIA